MKVVFADLMAVDGGHSLRVFQRGIPIQNRKVDNKEFLQLARDLAKVEFQELHLK